MDEIMKGAQTLPAGRLTEHTSTHKSAMRAASIRSTVLHDIFPTQLRARSSVPE